MDRFIVREPRAAANFPQGNQMMAYPTNAPRNNVMSPENVYYTGPYASQAPNIQHVGPSHYVPELHITQPFYGQTMMPPQGQVMTGIDPRYLANYCDNSAQFIVTGQSPMQANQNPVLKPSQVPSTSAPGFGENYQSNNLAGLDRNRAKAFAPKVAAMPLPVNQNVVPKKPAEPEPMKKDSQIFNVSRADKLKALHKSGPRAFSGPVEKVLKWHKALQDIGVFVFYEIVAKCVSIRPGESCAKNLVIRDDNGPAMQVVYYEIDFLLPEIKVPSTIRVVGRMMVGTCRLQAFNVRPATGDDVAMLPRRAAVAAHHVARLCKEYGLNK